MSKDSKTNLYQIGQIYSKLTGKKNPLRKPQSLQHFNEVVYDYRKRRNSEMSHGRYNRQNLQQTWINPLSPNCKLKIKIPIYPQKLLDKKSKKMIEQQERNYTKRSQIFPQLAKDRKHHFSSFILDPYQIKKIGPLSKSVIYQSNPTHFTSKIVHKTDLRGRSQMQRRYLDKTNHQEQKIQQYLAHCHESTKQFVEQVKKKYSLNFNKNKKYLKFKYNQVYQSSLKKSDLSNQTFSKIQNFLEKEEDIFSNLLEEIVNLNIEYKYKQQQFEVIQNKMNENIYNQYLQKRFKTEVAQIVQQLPELQTDSLSLRNSRTIIKRILPPQASDRVRKGLKHFHYS